MPDMTCAEFRRLRHIAKHGPVVNMTATDADRALFDAGLLTADRNAVYVSPAGIAAMADLPAVWTITGWSARGTIVGGTDTQIAEDRDSFVRHLLADPRTVRVELRKSPAIAERCCA